MRRTRRKIALEQPAPVAGWPEKLELAVEHIDVARLRLPSGYAREGTEAQEAALMGSVSRLGFVNPILTSRDLEIFVGVRRYQVSVRLGRKTVPIIRLPHLNRAQLRALRIADNRIAELGSWDIPALAQELAEIETLDDTFEIDDVGFTTSELDALIETIDDSASNDPLDRIELPAENAAAVSRLGDVFICGRHRIACGDARGVRVYESLLNGEKAQLVFIDPPFNVPIDGHATGLGRHRHREFAMASGEMTPDQYVAFLRTAIGHLVAFSVDGAIHFVCQDWRHMHDLLRAAEGLYSEFKNLCVWVKSNGGMGSFYRSQHELVFAFKCGKAPHLNNFSLGQGGRYRTNVWAYAGANTFRRGRDEDLASHPTVKPVALVADAIKDVSRRNGVVLDAFGGSGTTMIAAEKTRRRARLIEIDPLYVDTTIRRWEAMTGEKAVHAENGKTFDALTAERSAKREAPAMRVRHRTARGARG